MKINFHKVIRVLTIPPVVVSVLLVQLILNKTIDNALDGILLILLLGIIPVLAYPVNKIFKGDRKSERGLAFIFTFISYSTGFIYSILAKSSNNIKFIYFVYFFSIILLTITNLLFTKASGHMASLTGFVLISFNNISYFTLLYTIPLFLGTWFSSLKLKRHTYVELTLGTIIPILSYIITKLII